MAPTSFPFDNQDVTEAQYAALFSEFQDSGVADSSDSSSLKVGADSSGMKVTAQAGFAVLRGFGYNNDAVQTLTIAAAGSASRTDRVILRLNPAINTIELAVLKGSSDQSAPALTQTNTGIYEIALATVAVAVGAVTISDAAVIDSRTFTSSRVGTWSTLTRPLSPRKGQLGLNTTTSRWEYHNGGEWADLAPTVTWTNIQGKPVSFPPAAHAHDWNSIESKPSSFLPASHKHPIADVTSLQGDLDGKAQATHNHDGAYASKAGRWGAGYVNTGTSNELSLSWRGSYLEVNVDSTFFRLAVFADIQWLDNKKAEWTHGHTFANNADWATNSGTSNRSNGSDRVRGSTPAGSGWYSVWVDGNNDFCHNTSSRRYKENIEDFGIEPSDVLAMRPVVYDRKPTTRADGTIQEGQKNEVGLIAEEVAEHAKWLVQYNEHGEVESLRYDLLGVALLPVVQAQARQLTEQQAQIDRLYELLGEDK
ncbi:tail fiber domain-containing protein [Rhodococcus antarcticus]|uniref:Tail fiber domain-containing protein n=1 Tax=Rhodococcus antarcticus TaxID=2987751 RepID=A0ABY6NWF3_9NOCA|nr:tail fiber domain-containing protein [Rhodococcus antarcticus]UZJ23724.1 tail fiber domain-containing protein [Rhodococcus antarcticus]